MWFTNFSRSTALWVRGSTASRIAGDGNGEDYVWVRVADVTHISVYLSPNCSAAEFERRVAALENLLRDITTEVILAGNVNVRSIKWGMTTTINRRLLLEMAARLDLAVANVGQVTTCRRLGYGISTPNLTVVADNLLRRVGGGGCSRGKRPATINILPSV